MRRRQEQKKDARYAAPYKKNGSAAVARGAEKLYAHDAATMARQRAAMSSELSAMSQAPSAARHHSAAPSRRLRHVRRIHVETVHARHPAKATIPRSDEYGAASDAACFYSVR